MILAWFFEEVCFLEESYENMQKNQILKFWERPLFNISEYAFKHITIINQFLIFLCF